MSYQKIVSLTQPQLFKYLEAQLRRYYPERASIISTSNYLIAKGTIPIALCAHLDTVFDQTCPKLYFDRKEQVVWGINGAGHDDRAGVFMILQILSKTNLRPHIIFCADEEIGCAGASELAKIKPFSTLAYILQLDRHGENDSVFYDCYNPAFEAYILSNGFKKAYGTFSDISVLCPAWGVAGANLSIGYYNEHTYNEILRLDHFNATLEKVKNILSNYKGERFIYGTRKLF